MTAPLYIPLSEHQQARFAGFQREIAEAQRTIDAIVYRKNDAMTAIIAGVVDPDSLATWAVELTPGAIVCTPPVEGAD